MIEFKLIEKIVKDTEKSYSFGIEPSGFLKELDFENCEDITDIITVLREYNSDGSITNEDIIYYSNALKYLSEKDQSLRESVEIAIEYGYELKDIDSEKLASLLKTQNNESDFGDFLQELSENLESVVNNVQ